MQQEKLKAYAKINLGLDVIGRLPDGYHQVKMVMQTVGIYDELTFERAEQGIQITTDSGILPTDENNLIYKAARLMMEKYRIEEGIRVHLQKNIPIAAGMAGGSTDAAAAMQGMNRLFRLGVPKEELMREAVSIGADVPYCLLGGTALAEGIGEELTVLPPVPDMVLLVAKPEISVSTKYVYEHLDSAEKIEPPDIDGMVSAIREQSMDGILERMENVLETVTIPAHPVIAGLKERMLELGAKRSLMSGSGPTVFGVFESEEKAQYAYERMQQEKKAEQLFVTHPVPGGFAEYKGRRLQNMQDYLQPQMDEFLPLRDVVFNTLRQAILRGELKPGERLMEIHLANQLGVSRTPIREAIRKLELEGLVTMIPRRGAEVAQITEKSMNDVLEVRRALDALCVELACERITPEELDNLKEACGKFEQATQAGDIQEIARADVALHDIIVQATGNQRLIQLVNNLAEQMYRYRFEYIKDASQHKRLVEEHRIIYESIRKKDKKTAAEAAKTHIDNQEKAIIRQIRLDSAAAKK